MNSEEAYRQLCEWSNKLTHINSAIALLHWDQSTNLPKNGIPGRIKVLSTLTGMKHALFVDPKIGDLLDEAQSSSIAIDPLCIESVNLREWRRNYDRIKKIPESLARQLAEASAEGQSVWEKSKPEDDWDSFRPYLEKLLELKKQEADLMGYEEERYDALLDIYEPSATAKGLVPKFSRLIPALQDLLLCIKEQHPRKNPGIRNRTFPIPAQEKFAVKAAKRIGYDFDAGRLDVSAHPFTSGIHPGDVRITTRYSENYFNESFFAVLHEAGHGIYHQGLPIEYWGTPFCSPASLGINESQSRMWENFVGRSMGFWQYFFPFAQEKFDQIKSAKLEDFFFSINEVRPSYIRVEADEVTYNLHVLLRFELELALMRDDLRISDLPEAWNSKVEQLLGLPPTGFSKGVMQDVHWAGGSFGYFPTYTLGNMYAAQFFAKANSEVGPLEEQFALGEFSHLFEWLRRNIHQEGRRFSPTELVQRITGEELNPDHLINYLTAKYKLLYECS